jgi:hypothetical protein
VNERGDYRSLYVAFADDEDVHALSGVAFKLLIMLKLSLPVTGLGVIYPSKLCDQVGCDRPILEAAFVELEAPKSGRELGWIRRHGNVVWVVRAFECEPGMSRANYNHAKYVQKLVAPINSHNPVVAEFVAFYQQWFQQLEKPTAKPRKGAGKAIGGHSESPPDQKQANSKRIALTKQETKSGDLEQERGAAPTSDSTASAPPARALDPSDLPREAIAFVVRFYPRGSDPKRRRDVVTQLLATLGDGARYQQSLVRAQNPGRLAAKCRDVLREGVRDPNAAIVVLLAKLADSTDYTDAQRQVEHVERESEQKQTMHDLLAAEQWLTDQPDISTSIDEQLERDGFPAVQVASDDDAGFTAMARRMMRTQLAISQWRLAGAPEAAHAGSGS